MSKKRTIKPSLSRSTIYDIAARAGVSVTTVSRVLNDAMAVGALHVARRRGISVREDLSLLGVDNAGLAETVVPRLTTIRQPLKEMGRVAVSLLWRILQGRWIEAAPILRSTQLVVRESTEKFQATE
jgi:LacI family transcriptional regulator